MILITLVFLFAVACRKDDPIIEPPIIDYPDSLTGDTAILVGTWKWQYTEHQFNWCYGPTLYEVLDSATESTSYSIEIFENGIARTYSNSQQLDEYEIYFDAFGLYCHEFNDSNLFYAKFNQSEVLPFIGCVKPDTLRVVYGFPFFNYEEGCEDYISYFIRQ